MRFRLRFLLQEFDLLGPEILLGRSPDCHITIEDPLISRRHARIEIDDDDASVEDLGSRNGVRLNGRKLTGKAPLKDGDRIRLGTQELLFSVVQHKERSARPTGYMRVCHACKTPYPDGSLSCPHCGVEADEEEDTVSGMTVEPSRHWTFDLLGEVIDRALGSSRVREADRMLRRAAKEVDDRLAANERITPEHTSMIAGFALRLARLDGGVEWIAWALTLHKRLESLPSREVVDRLVEIDLRTVPEAREILTSFLDWARARPGQGDDERLQRLAQLV
jgi:uncharacterized Zn finger protein (UPF0148 family)